MILVLTGIVNNITQNIYDQIINQINICQLTCPKCAHCDMVIHGYYNRHIKTPAGTIIIRIMRVKCRQCGKTHAILLSSFVPYSWITLKDTVSIITSKSPEDRALVMENNVEIDESDIYRILRNYKLFWKEKLNSFNIKIDEDITETCIKLFKRQFMQIPCTICGSYSCHHIVRQDLHLSFT